MICAQRGDNCKPATQPNEETSTGSFLSTAVLTVTHNKSRQCTTGAVSGCVCLFGSNHRAPFQYPRQSFQLALGHKRRRLPLTLSQAEPSQAKLSSFTSSGGRQGHDATSHEYENGPGDRSTLGGGGGLGFCGVLVASPGPKAQSICTQFAYHLRLMSWALALLLLVIGVIIKICHSI